MLLPTNKPKSLITILENGFLLSHQRFSMTSILSFLGVLCLAFSILVKTHLLVGSPFNVAILLSCMLISQIFFGGLLFLLYSINKNLPCSFKVALLTGIQKLPELIITFFLYNLMVFIGTVAFVIPGIYLSITVVFSFILIYTDNHDPILALMTSFNLCKKHLLLVSFTLFTLSLFVILVNLLGLALGYLIFISLSLDPNSMGLFISNLTMLAIINTLTIPIFYGVMLSLLQELKLKQIQV